MATMPLADGWTCRPFEGPFAAFGGAPAGDDTVTVPHDALRDAVRDPAAPSGGGGAYHPGAAVRYRRTLTAPPEWDQRIVRMEVQGAYRHAQVFVNDELAGHHADGYARFMVDLTPFLRPGAENELRIETRATVDSRWYSGAGLHRPVLLHVDPLAHIAPDGVRVTTLGIDPEGVAALEVAVTLTNRGHSTASMRVRTAVHGPDGAPLDQDSIPATVAPGATTVVRHRFHLEHAALWSPDHPLLHEARVTLDGADDPRIVPFGVRTLTVDARRGLRINGESVLLRGACIHHDNGPLGAVALPRAEERRIALLREAGFNAIRAAHNPLSVAMLDACDRLGMLVMDELGDMWTRGKTAYDHSFDFPRWWREDLAALVAKDQNHPSVIMYSIGNEIIEVGTPHGAALARDMAEHLRALDPTRLITNGVNVALAVLDEMAEMRESEAGLNEQMADPAQGFNALSATESATRRIEESSAALDVLGLNYADSRYELDRELHPHRVLVGSETFPAQIGSLWPQVERHSHVIGDFTWTGWDYLGEVGIGAVTYAEDGDVLSGLERAYPYLTAWCGDIDITGWRRPMSYYREIVFGLRTEPYIAVRRPSRSTDTVALQTPWAWSDTVSSWTWRGHEGRAAAVEVYADADEVALELGGVEVARAVVGERLPRVADLEIEYQPGTLVAIALRGGVETGRTSLFTAGEAVLTVTADRDRLVAGVRDLAYVAIELRDAAGVLVVDGDVPVTVAVRGAGRLAGMCSANPCTEERFDARTWVTFDGRALAVVEAGTPGDDASGTIEVTVTAPGLAPATLTLTVGD
ncbi:glycoside hydrolase family 2 TIM barrel-domain containing protein [Demequina sp.]|uniref:glycoside hydrolase family 2 TIM barrel-domain containing protein n=1 Tax=Demequina sp. TaxID=2050685 RepID=UPI0025D35DB9|nr:glycoside hydrolase family 2 TIM barrel-domain containing protein [Demequina sp.]